jgi:signal recognition particle GTPase
MLPGFSAELMPKGREKESSAKIKRYMTMMDSMTNEGESRPFFCGFALHVPHG